MAKVLKITVTLAASEDEPGTAIFDNTIILSDVKWTAQRERDFASRLENVINAKMSEFLDRFS